MPHEKAGGRPIGGFEMRRLVAVLLVGSLVAVSLAPSALAGKKKKKKPVVQIEAGEVFLPTPYPHPSSDDCFSGLHRRLSVLSGSASPHQGTFGWEFDVDERTWGKNFVLEVTGGASPDLDITFYGTLGTVDQVVGDPVYAGSPYAVTYGTRNTDGEAGEVPSETTKVIVCMMAGGAQATFDYRAGHGVKLPT